MKRRRPATANLPETISILRIAQGKFTLGFVEAEFLRNFWENPRSETVDPRGGLPRGVEQGPGRS
ncbi:MAG TPA: hypothetical protein VMB23_08840, partial [Spirochaetia bacterium]|nr:hypothetical protein [Spirochaetia bacterium]